MVSIARRYLPQFIASFARNLLYISLGLSDAFMTIVIPALTGISTELNPNETLRITAEQASWLGEWEQWLLKMMTIQNHHSICVGYPDKLILCNFFIDFHAASISLAIQPLGCLLTGVLNDTFGRRRTMMLVNIPFIAAWIMLAYANSIVMIGIGFGLNGLGIGLMFAPCLTYCSEIWWAQNCQESFSSQTIHQSFPYNSASHLFVV